MGSGVGSMETNQTRPDQTIWGLVGGWRPRCEPVSGSCVQERASSGGARARDSIVLPVHTLCDEMNMQHNTHIVNTRLCHPARVICPLPRQDRICARVGGKSTKTYNWSRCCSWLPSSAAFVPDAGVARSQWSPRGGGGPRCSLPFLRQCGIL